jgi:hypothetical protein
MTTLADPQICTRLVARLARLTPETARRWGTLTPAELLCHLGDAGESVLGWRVPPGPKPSGKSRPIIKWLFLTSPIPWPRGVATRPGVNPRLEGTRPTDFEQDRGRVVAGLQALAKAPADGLSPAHSFFGPMSRADWHRWAYRHVDHHLRQFGL